MKDTITQPDKIDVQVEQLPKSIIKFTIHSTPQDMEIYLEKAYEKLHKNVAVKGFRKGTAPKNMIIAELGMKLLEEAINLLVWNLTDKAVIQEKIRPLNTPDFEILENKDNIIIFSAVFAVYPTVNVGDLKKITLKKDDIKKARAKREELQKEPAEVEEKADKDGKTPQDEFNLEKYYSEVFDKVLISSEIDLPDVLLDYEVENKVSSFTKRLEELDINPENYLMLQNMTLEQAKENWRKEIEFLLKQDLILVEHAEKNHITVEKDEVEEAVKQAYPESEIKDMPEKVYTYTEFAIKKQKSFMDLINFIENNNVSTNSN